jgi:hypothetical protein
MRFGRNPSDIVRRSLMGAIKRLRNDANVRRLARSSEEAVSGR